MEKRRPEWRVSKLAFSLSFSPQTVKVEIPRIRSIVVEEVGHYDDPHEIWLLHSLALPTLRSVSTLHNSVKTTAALLAAKINLHSAPAIENSFPNRETGR